MNLPSDRGHLSTEQRHPRSRRFDAFSTRDCIALMVDDHRDVVTAVDHAAPAICAFIEELVDRMRLGGRLIYIGAGTSGRLGVLDASECPPTFQSAPAQVVGIIAGGDRSLRRSSEGKEDDRDGAAPALRRLRLTNRDTVLGIAAGGTTPYVLGAIDFAAARGAMTGLLTCANVAKPPRCHHFIALRTGPEILTGSTRLKAGSATKLALNIITTTAFTRLGKVYSNLMVDLRASNDKLRDRAIRILRTLCPSLTRARAATLLKQAGGDLKAAILMQRASLSLDEALAALHACDRNLRAALKTARRRPTRRQARSKTPKRRPRRPR